MKYFKIEIWSTLIISNVYFASNNILGFFWWFMSAVFWLLNLYFTKEEVEET